MSCTGWDDLHEEEGSISFSISGESEVDDGEEGTL